MTPYQKIIEEFLIKISQDKEYFVYGNRTEQEVNDIIEKRSIALLKLVKAVLYEWTLFFRIKPFIKYALDSFGFIFITLLKYEKSLLFSSR